MKPAPKKPARKQKAAPSKARHAKNPTKAPKSRAVVPQKADAVAGSRVPAKGDNWLKKEAAELGPHLSRSVEEAVDRWGKRRTRASDG